MKIGIVTNIAGKGLQVDAELLQEFLSSLDHEVTLVQFNQPWSAGKVDLGISLEVVVDRFFEYAPRWFFFPNTEWLKSEYIKPARKFDRVFAKTRDGERQLRTLFPNVEYVGFLSKDKLDSSVPREPRFLHVGGDSGNKNTNAVISAYREYRYWNGIHSLNAPLTIISSSTTTVAEDTPDIAFLKHVDEKEVTRLQNACQFHLMPSAAEGYGHALRESQSVGAIILTTRAGAMAEIQAPFEVLPISSKKHNLGELWEVSGQEIRETIPRMLEQPSHVIARMRLESRLRWERDQKMFREAFAAVLTSDLAQKAVRHVSTAKAAKTGVKTQATVAIWGNLEPEFSTENEWRRAFETLGHKVVCFQENTFNTEEIVPECLKQDIDLLLYIHTHSFLSPGNISCEQVVHDLRAKGVKTVAPHLDLFFGLHGDRRDENVGKHASWKVDYAMTADGSPLAEREFAARGVRHVWMKPGVDAGSCYFGKPRKEYEGILIGFTGQRNYHSEWPWREQMVSTLENVYGDKFRAFTGYRGQQLNDLYASIPIWVADCCFAGRPNYWSDRWPESCGRGAFLLAPAIEGNCIPLATYRPQDMVDLLNQIDYYVNHDDEREWIRKAAAAHVASHDTYCHRAQQILKTVGLGEK